MTVEMDVLGVAHFKAQTFLLLIIRILVELEEIRRDFVSLMPAHINNQEL